MNNLFFLNLFVLFCFFGLIGFLIFLSGGQNLFSNFEWDWEFTFNEVLPRLIKYIPITIEATLLGFLIAVILGLFLAIGRISKNNAGIFLKNY